MKSEELRYEADGLAMVGQLYLPEGMSGKRPGVLVYPEAFGLGEHAKGRAQRLAEQGYVALACDLHGAGTVIDDLGEVMGKLEPLRTDANRARARSGGAFAALKARSEVDVTRIAAIGFCFGGTMGLELARDGADIRGVVSFHGGLASPAPGAENIKAKIVVCTGADDPGVPAEQRAAFEEEMRAGKVDWQMHVYGGVVHSFTNPDADKMGRPEMLRYDAVADARSWATMTAFFHEIF